MATIRKVVGQITLKVLVDVASVTYFYLLMPSIAPAPSKPTTSPPTIYQTDGYSGWSTTEPGYTSGDTRSLYVTVRTTYSDGTFDYTTPSLSSSYEAAKEAYNRAQSAMSLAGDTNQYFWNIPSAYSTDVPAGVYVTSISQNSFKPNPSGGNIVIQGTGLTIRNGTTQLASLTGQALNFYNPQATSGQNSLQLSIGANGTLQSGNYSRGSDSKFSYNGTKIDLINGDIITKYFRLSQGLESLNAGAYIHGTIEALDGSIGSDATNYWEIGNDTDYNLNSMTAKMIGHGSSYIQLGDSSTWRLATNRIHTGWYISSDSLLHFPAISSKYWDFGIHSPSSATDKFLYIRSSKANTSASNILPNLLYDIDDSYATPQWDYRFYIDGSGNLYANNLYFFDENGNPIQVGGANGAYLPKTGGTITGNLEVNGTLTKGGQNVAYLTDTSTNGQILIADGTTGGIKTSGYTIATSVPQNAVFTDKNVQTDLNNSTQIYLAGPTTTATNTGTLKFDSNVYVDTAAGALHATTFNGYTLAAAAAKGVDTSMTSTSTSTNLPTTKAVADLIATYLPLAGGTVSGAVDINDELYADSATFGNLIVNGVGRFTNGIYGDLTGNVTGNVTGSLTGNATTATTATKVGNNLIIKLNSGTTEGTNMFTYNGSAAKTVDITKSAIGLGNVENKSSATIRGELTSSNVTTALGFTPYNSTNPNGYVSSSGVTSITLKAGNGISLDTDNTAITTTGTRTISHSDTSSQTSSSNSGRTYIQSVTLDNFGHVTGLSTATETVTNTDTKLQVAAVTSGTTYYPIVGSGTTAATRQYDTTGFVYVGTNGTTSAVGSAKLTLGNSTASGTANNKQGQIVLYGSTAYTTIITPGAPTAARTIILPDKTGTIALTSDIPSSLKNPNALSINIYNATTQTDSGYTTTDYDGSTPNQSVNVAGNNAITNITSNTNGQLVIQRASGVAPETVTVKITATTSDTAASADKLNLSTDAGSVSVPVYVPANTGIPIAVESIAYSLLPTGTSASTVAVGNHTHGNITNGGDITAAAPTVANGDQIIINDHSASKVTNGPTFDGSTTTKALTPKGTWETFATSNTNTTYTLTNALASHKFTWTFTAGGSGSGSTTTTAELVAGTGISLTDDTSNKKITIGNSGVTSITTTAGTHTTKSSATGAVSFNVPTKTSHLTNDSGFLTNSTLYESKLNWGNSSLSGNVTPMGASLSTEHSANRIAFLNPAAIQIEYTTNGGSTWLDSGYTDNEKMWLCTGNSAVAVGQSKSGYSQSTSLTINHWTRITLTGQNGTAGYVYTAPRKMLINMGTALGVDCLVEYKTGVSGASWQTFGTYAVSGWSGWNDIPLVLGTFGGGSNQTSNVWYIRLTFKVSSTRTDTYKGYAQILGLRLFGATDWTSASSSNGKGPISSTGHLYSYDIGANATFPAQVTATQFNGNATSATKANLTTTANAVAYYTDAAGTFGSKASANGALYATSANGALTFGTLPAAQGGTGKTNLKDAANALINALDTGSSNLTSNDYVITQYVGGGTTTTTYHRRPASALRVGGLLTGRKLKVALGSTTDVTFDGTSDVTNIPVSGTLGVSNGGTGATSFTSGALLIGNGSNAIGARNIVNNTTVGALGWTGSATTATNLYIPTLNTLAYWNGAYSGTTSNLAYCNKGAFGTTVTSNGTGLPTSGEVYSAIRNASDTYVTLSTIQNITANKIFSAGTKWTTESGTNPSKFGACSYNATLEALVFSFS